MIRYSLKCSDEHCFDSWFKSADAYENLRASALINCPECDSSEISKLLMAPKLHATRPSARQSLSEPETVKEKSLAEFRKKVEDNSEYVGVSFAKEARKIHDGDAPERAIYGEAKPADAIKLLKDGIPVAPLPFLPKRQTN